jgi:hypothetical protein
MTSKLEQAQQGVASMILDELQGYERFRLWVEANYQIHVMLNDTEQCIEVKVIEEDFAIAQEKLSRLVRDRMAKNEDKIQIAGIDVLEKLKKI